MKFKIIYLIFYLSLVLQYSCKNDIIIDNEINQFINTCDLGIENFTINITNNDTTWNFNNCVFDQETPLNGKEFQKILSSPIDSNKICYLKFDYDSSDNCLLNIFDFCTGESIVLQNINCSELDWSVSDWILFKKDYALYKIKSSGDSLTEINSVPNNFKNFKWAGSGDLISHNKGNATSAKFVIVDEELNEVNSIDELKYTGIHDWSSNDKIAVVAGVDSTSYGIYVYDILNSSFSPVYITNFEFLIHELDWDNNNENIFYTTTNGIYKYNLASNLNSEILDYSSNRTYRNLSIFLDNNMILLGRQNKELIDECYVGVSEKLYALNLLTGLEKEITIE